MRSAVNFKVRILLILFAQVINKHFRINTSINLESLAEISQHFERKKLSSFQTLFLDKKEQNYWVFLMEYDSFTVVGQFLS